MQELWQPIDGADGYEVSNLGRIRTQDRVTIRKNGSPLRTKGRLFPFRLNHNGYPVYSYKSTHKLIHVAVARAFIAPVEGKRFVNHIDGDKANNRVDNLEWADHSDNKLHALRTGLQPRKLSNDQIRCIKKRLSEGESQTSIAKSFGVSQATIGHINTGFSYYWVT